MLKNELLLNWNEFSNQNNVETVKKSSKVTRINVGESSYYLKLKKSIQEIERETYLYNALKTMGIHVPKQLQTKHHKRYVEVEGTLYCLYESLDGEVITGNCSLKQAFAFGDAIAQLHQGLFNVSVKELNIPQMDIQKQLNDWVIPTSLTLNDKVKAVESYLKTMFIPNVNYLPLQPIHRDPNPSNILFTEDGKLSGFVDFDLMCIGLRIFDLCYCSTAILMGNFEAKDKWLDLLFEMVKGYQSFNKLTNEEIDSIFSVLLSIQLIFIAYFKKDNEQLALDNMEGLLWIFNNEDKIKERLAHLK